MVAVTYTNANAQRDDDAHLSSSARWSGADFRLASPPCTDRGASGGGADARLKHGQSYG